MLLLHSIALPTACGSRVPPQRTVLGETSTAPGQDAAPDTVIRIRKLLGRYDLHTVQRLAALGAAMEPERAAEIAYAAANLCGSRFGAHFSIPSEEEMAELMA